MYPSINDSHHAHASPSSPFHEGVTPKGFKLVAYLLMCKWELAPNIPSMIGLDVFRKIKLAQVEPRLLQVFVSPFRASHVGPSLHLSIWRGTFYYPVTILWSPGSVMSTMLRFYRPRSSKTRSPHCLVQGTSSTVSWFLFARAHVPTLTPLIYPHT